MSERGGSPTDHVRFIILSGARTGSNMLASALNSSSRITCFREIFNITADFIDFHVDGYDRNSVTDRDLRDSDFAAFLEQRIFVDRDGVRATGFKMPYTHFLGFPGLIEWLAQRTDIRVLHLRRRNLLRMFVSTRIARATGGWVDDNRGRRRLSPALLFRAARHPLRYAKRVPALLRPDDEPPWKAERESLSLTSDECIEFFQKTALHSKYYDGIFSDHPLLTLHYEDITADQRTTFDRVQTFLDVEPERLDVTTGQQNPESLPQLIANYDELRAEFRGTPYGAFFDDA